jgi:carbamoyl-phosphate synthase large subunit
MSQLDIAGRILVTDITDTSPAFHRADKGLLVPPVGRIEYVPTLLDIVREHQVDLLVPLTDLDLRSLARQQHHFAEAGCTVMIGPEETVTLCRDKTRTNSLLESCGLDTIRTLSLNEFRTHPFYPCFVKPIRGSASIGTGRIENEKELQAHIATFGDLLIVQELVDGEEFTIDVYRSRDGQVRCVVPRKRLVVRSGEVEKGRTVHDPSLMDATCRLADQLEGLWGVFCAQCRREGDRIRFFEINPRFGGGAPLAIAAGANLPLYLLQEVLGKPITAEMGRFTDGLLMMRYDASVFVRSDELDTSPYHKGPLFH